MVPNLLYIKCYSKSCGFVYVIRQKAVSVSKWWLFYGKLFAHV